MLINFCVKTRNAGMVAKSKLTPGPQAPGPGPWAPGPGDWVPDIPGAWVPGPRPRARGAWA